MDARKKIEDAKQVLRDAGYFVDSLWSIHDVTSIYECTRAEAEMVIDGALTNDATAEQVLFAIGMYADDMGLTEK